ncbi:MAG TPA: hypothetical protein VIK91_15025 [Nannocystis sp.]
MSLRPRLFLVAACLAALVPATTFADSTGSSGVVEELAVYESGSDNYAMANGILTVKESGGTKREYKWGGSLCAGRNVSANSISLLFDAMRSQSSVNIIPSYKVGSGNTRCLTGFKLVTNRTAPS